MERIGIYKDLKVSYGEFTKALSQLGYYKMPTDEATLYINDDYDSIIRISNHHKPDKMMLLAVFTSEAYLMEMKGVIERDRKSTRLNSSHRNTSRMPSSA